MQSADEATASSVSYSIQYGDAYLLKYNWAEFCRRADYLSACQKTNTLSLAKARGLS